MRLRWRSQRHPTPPSELLFPPLVSLFFVLLSQVAVAAVPRFFPSLPLLAMLPIAGVVMVATLGTGRCCRRLFGISASAPAFVLFSTLFLWGVYIFVIREVIPSLLDATVNVQCALLMFGLYRILSSDPGVVTYGGPHSEELNQCTSSELQSEDALSFKRILWQVIFLIWHIYCICFNIKTDEWINWKKYPEFQVAVQPQPGQSISEVKFWNPYDKGIAGNIGAFLGSK